MDCESFITYRAWSGDDMCDKVKPQLANCCTAWANGGSAISRCDATRLKVGAVLAGLCTAIYGD